MGKQYRVIRKVATVPVVAGGFATVDLPRDYDYEAVFFRINGGLQVTVNGTAVRAEAPCQTVSRIEIVADGKNNLFSAPFWFASLGNYARKLTEQGARVTTPPTGFVIATYQVEAIASVDFMTVDGVRPKDTNFRSSGLSLFQARLTFGNAVDNFVGGTVNFSSMNVDIFVTQIVEMPDASGVLSKPVAIKKVTYQELALLASNANQEVRLPAGNLIKSVLIRTDGSTTAGEPSVAVLNNVQLAAGVDVRVNLSGVNLLAKNNADCGKMQLGYYALDITTKGGNDVNLTDLWDVTGAAEPKLIMDVTGGATVKAQAVVTEYIPI
jgi:hypothetical protein